ncbi:MAG: ATP-binding protein [Oscillospiraceae bacterium]|nr:ATP-binding protein [Oscillospiraceae bacterium]
MKFDTKYHISAENELKRRKAANLKEAAQRRERLEAKYPELARLRVQLATTGAKIAAAVLARADKETLHTKIDEIQAENIAVNARVKELLMKGGYPHDYLEPLYFCKICKDTGVAGLSRCECYTGAVKRLAAQDMNAATALTLTGFDTFKLDFYPDTEIDNIGNARKIMLGVFNFCENYAENFHLPSAGVLLRGQTGLGKTHLSLAIAKRVLEKGYSVIYDSAPDLFRKIESEHFSYERDRSENTMDSLQSCELLVLDDIGAEFDSKFYNSALYNLINTRMNLGYPTIINTNLNTDELNSRYGDRIMSRFMTMEILVLHGEDNRQK